MSILTTFIARLRYRLFGTRRSGETFGRQGENAAVDFLRRLGYTVLAQGEMTRMGEIDIIAIDGHTVVFIEVKTRKSHDRGHPADAVDTAKQTRITRLALAFLKRHRLLEYRARCDVIAITWPDGQKEPDLQHYINAFEAVGQGQMFS